MNEPVQVGRWLLRPDVARTTAAHSQLKRSGAAECACSGCANFEAVRPQLLVGPLGPILEQLGISPPWEVEAYHNGRESTGLHHYGAWFHFVGIIESGPEAWVKCNEQHEFWTPNFDRLSATLSIGFHADPALVRPPFEGLPLVQLDITVEVPWVIDIEELI